MQTEELGKEKNTDRGIRGRISERNPVREIRGRIQLGKELARGRTRI